jgi:hypothetical protein
MVQVPAGSPRSSNVPSSPVTPKKGCVTTLAYARIHRCRLQLSSSPISGVSNVFVTGASDGCSLKIELAVGLRNVVDVVRRWIAVPDLDRSGDRGFLEAPVMRSACAASSALW